VNDPVDSLPPESTTPPLKPSEILDSPMDTSP
jgi:hypothetical protein